MPPPDNGFACSRVLNPARAKEHGSLGSTAADQPLLTNNICDNFSVSHAVLQGQYHPVATEEPGCSFCGKPGMGMFDKDDGQICLLNCIRIAGGLNRDNPRTCSAADGESLSVENLDMLRPDIQ